MTRRGWGSGTVFLQHHRHWTASIPLPPTVDGKRRRKYVRCASREDAEAKLSELFAQQGQQVPRRARLAKSEWRLSPVDAARLAIERGQSQGFSAGTMAEMVLASQRLRRLEFGVTGPCVYCGDELAATVDHVDPDGGDGPANVVSACLRCNVAKGKRTPAQWRAAGR